MRWASRGQTSMEYLLVVAFAFFLLIPIILITMSQSARFSSDVTAAQVQKIGNELLDTINSVYYSGPPTKRTLKLYFPNGINNLAFEQSRIVFTVQGTGTTYEYALYAATNISGTIKPFSGIHTITITAGDTYVNVTE